MLSDREDSVWIISTRDVDNRPVCQLQWGPIEWYANVADVRETARDLIECAIHAEVMLLLSTKVGLEAGVVSDFMSEVIARSRFASLGKRFFGCKSTITLTPGASSKRREAVVILQRGSKRGAVSPAVAREMAQTWLTAAEATDSDRCVAEALQSVGKVDEGWTEGFFAYLKLLRGGQQFQDADLERLQQLDG